MTYRQPPDRALIGSRGLFLKRSICGGPENMVKTQDFKSRRKTVGIPQTTKFGDFSDHFIRLERKPFSIANMKAVETTVKKQA
jgi:hypothetical protein